MNEKEAPKIMLAVCKHCAQPVEVVIPDYMKKVEPCKCGLTEGSRTSRHIATAVTIVLASVAFSISGGSLGYNYYEAQKAKLDLDRYLAGMKKAEGDAAAARSESERQKAEAVRQMVELEKYKGTVNDLIRKAMSEEIKKTDGEKK